MLQNILLKIELSISESGLLESSKMAAFIELFKRYNKGNWVYPGVIMRHLNISSEETYKLLEFLKHKGILETNYELYCHSCNTFKSKVYGTFSQIPNELYCYECDSELSIIDNIVVIYKVIHDENS